MKNILLEIKLSGVVSFFLYPFLWVFGVWSDFYMSNSEYVQFVLGAVLVDWVLGSIYHAFWRRDFTFKKNIKGLVVKIGLVVLVGFLFEGVGYFVKDAVTITGITVGALRLVVFLFPTLSALWSAYHISGKKFPPIGIMNKITQFNKELKISEDEDSTN